MRKVLVGCATAAYAVMHGVRVSEVFLFTLSNKAEEAARES